MRFFLSSLLFAGLCCLAALPAAAHEFWLQARPSMLAAEGVSELTLRVGENFDGELTPFVDERTLALRHYAAGAVADLAARLPRRTALPGLAVPIPAGTSLIAFDSQPIEFSLSADKFHAYLHDEGLDHVIEQRKAAGKDTMPGRERYRRHVKTLLRAGAVSDGTYALRTGQRMEITPLSDPFAAAPGATLRLKLTFDGKPLSDVLVKGWHRHQDQSQLLIIRARTDAAGEVGLSLPYAGEWMVSAVHMQAAQGTANADWDSFWGNLTFTLPGAP
jgi:hypothetical protein